MLILANFESLKVRPNNFKIKRYFQPILTIGILIHHLTKENVCF
jgi:hypothetical protein